jgi:hypothetical protein
MSEKRPGFSRCGSLLGPAPVSAACSAPELRTHAESAKQRTVDFHKRREPQADSSERSPVRGSQSRHQDQDYRGRRCHRRNCRSLRLLAIRFRQTKSSRHHQVFRRASRLPAPGSSILQHRSLFRRTSFAAPQRDDRELCLLPEPVPVLTGQPRLLPACPGSQRQNGAGNRRGQT